ncbi:MAG: metal ABC transporter ATP-binding protein [Verrucomicrobiia bacterium]
MKNDNENVLVSLNEVDIGYNNNAVLENISLEIKRGDFTALLGANGSGKTTLLKTIAGILKPLKGEIYYNEIENLIGYVPQKESLNPEFLLTGYEVVLMGTYGRARPGRPLQQKEKELAKKCLRLIDSESFAKKPFFELSGGQRQRILIARALAVRPKLLLLDEPTSGIDTPTAQSIMQTLQTLNSEQGLAVMLVTHDINAVKQYVKQILIIQNHKIYSTTIEDITTPEKIASLLDLSLG